MNPLIPALQARRNELINRADTLHGMARFEVLRIVDGFNRRILQLLVSF